MTPSLQLIFSWLLSWLMTCRWLIKFVTLDDWSSLWHLHDALSVLNRLSASSMSHVNVTNSIFSWLLSWWLVDDWLSPWHLNDSLSSLNRSSACVGPRGNVRGPSCTYGGRIYIYEYIFSKEYIYIDTYIYIYIYCIYTHNIYTANVYTYIYVYIQCIYMYVFSVYMHINLYAYMCIYP